MESCNFTNKANSYTSKEEIHVHIRPKLCHFDLHVYVVRVTLFCLKSFVPVTGLECSYGKIFIPVTEILVAKTEILVTAQPLILYELIDIFTKKRVARRDLGNRASPVTKQKRSIDDNLRQLVLMRQDSVLVNLSTCTCFLTSESEFFFTFPKNGSVGRWETKHFMGMNGGTEN